MKSSDSNSLQIQQVVFRERSCEASEAEFVVPFAQRQPRTSDLQSRCN